jgi:hypothetical protein
VLTLYDVGTADGRPYLVMELLDGETLRDCVGRGAMPAAGLGIAAAIARASPQRTRWDRTAISSPRT